jgi:hypothetical protein
MVFQSGVTGFHHGFLFRRKMELGIVYKEIQRARYLRHASTSLYRGLHVAYMSDPLLMLFVDQRNANRETLVPLYLAHGLVLLAVFSAAIRKHELPANDSLEIYKGSGRKTRP